MQIRVVSLKRTPGRLKDFKQRNSQYLPGFVVFDAVDGKDIEYPKLTKMGFDTNKNWRDPNLKRTLTHGEIGCFLSHWILWEECVKTNEPFLILEDDIEFTQPLPVDIDQQEGDLIYLAWSEQEPAGATETHPCYPYWTSAYIIKPEAAKYLLKSSFRHEIIPVDEVLPRVTDHIDVRSMADSPCRLRSAATTTEPANHKDYFIDFNTHVMCVASDSHKAERLTRSCESFGISLLNLWPKGKEWKGGLQDFSTGGGVKLNLLRKKLAGMKPNDVVLFVDAYDVFIAAELDEIIRRFLAFKTEVLFSAERYNWPDKHLSWPPSHTPYRYLCSGMFMGRVQELRNMLSAPLKEDSSDQLFLQLQYLTGKFDCKLDKEQYIFTNHEPEAEIKNRQIYNPITRCWSCIYHGNGGEEAKEKYDSMFRSAFPTRAYAMTNSFEVVGPEMLLIDYKTPEQCQEWIDISEKHGGWNPHPADKFPSHDIHLKDIGLWEEAENHWHEVVAPIIEKYWFPMHHHHLRKAFTMKYSPDTQKALGLHNDSSMVTGSVKLNDDYTGATLHFPRQKFNNSEIPVGKMLLFPSMVTHGHYVDELLSGTKYSATFWTARFKGEYL
jgi:GR25 family glycosyltransferase involved in LPS biosynthesis